ncbi:MAG: ABC-F family ATP-binding cassette domain-containing protein, partial [Planctomycetaceae bacterium]|nr:ABC-F family ATP-binding cassette domain-containing protein [Planctomycetaceae bacterium]
LEIRNASKRYGEQVLLDEASATITDDGKVGFVGRNGAGKSTLLKVILGEEELDGGEIIHHPRLRLGYLRQHDPFQPEESALDFLVRDSNQPDWKCGEVAGQFELKGDYLHGLVRELSGGWQTRVKLAALLLHEPNLLLLDEPTNFLDLRTQVLLEHFLRGFREACLIVSHDRSFLTATCDRTLDLSKGKLTTYPGKITAFLTQQREHQEHLQRVNATTLAKKKQLERFINKNRAKASTASQARSKTKQLERLELEDLESVSPTAAIRCPEVTPRQGAALRCQDLVIGYDDQTVAQGISLEIDHGARVAIVGDNGQGKTTFLRTLVGSLESKEGRIKWGYGCDVGTYAQHVYTTLPEHETVLDNLQRVSAMGTPTQRILNLAGAMLFRNAAVEKKIKVLSGGERARLCLSGLLLGGYNVLVLDEPGNHLDVETVEALASALCSYGGSVIFTSHDRTFVNAVATNVIEVGGGQVVHYPGSYKRYVVRIEQEVDDAEGLRASEKPMGKAEGKQRGNGGQDARKRRKAIAAIEKTVARLDADKRDKKQRMVEVTDPEEALHLHSAIQKVEKELADAEESWLLLQEDDSV